MTDRDVIWLYEPALTNPGPASEEGFCTAWFSEPQSEGYVAFVPAASLEALKEENAALASQNEELRLDAEVRTYERDHAMEEIERLRAAAQAVYDHLIDRIDNAPPGEAPVFAGIARLHDALTTVGVGHEAERKLRSQIADLGAVTALAKESGS